MFLDIVANFHPLWVLPELFSLFCFQSVCSQSEVVICVLRS